MNVTPFSIDWERSDSNREPRDYESPALTVELRSRRGFCVSTANYRSGLQPILLYAMPSGETTVLAEPTRRSLARASRLCWVCVALIFTYYVVYHCHHESKDNGGHLGDFRTFYQAAQFALQGRDLYTAGHNSSQMYVYPPLIAFVCTPLTHLSELQAAHVWLVLSAAMLLGAVVIASREMLDRFDVLRPGALGVAALIVCVLSENEMRGELTMLETDAIMVFMFALGLWWLDRRPIFCGMALAFAFSIKYLSIVMLPYLLIRRRWRAAGGMIGGAVFFALLPATLLGWRENLRCLRVALGGLLRWVGVPPEVSHSIKVHNIADDLSVSVTSALARMLQPHGVSNSLVLGAAMIVGFIVLAVAGSIYRGQGLPLLRWPALARQRLQPFRALVGAEWAGLVAAALIFSPDTNTRHLVMALIVNALAAALMLKVRGADRTRLVIAALLIFLGFIMPFPSMRLGRVTLHQFYFHYGIPGFALLIGYFLTLSVAVRVASTLALRAPDGVQSEPIPVLE